MQRLVNVAQIYVAPRLLGQGRPLLNIPGPERMIDGWRLKEVSVRQIGPDVCLEGCVVYPEPHPVDDEDV